MRAALREPSKNPAALCPLTGFDASAIRFGIPDSLAEYVGNPGVTEHTVGRIWVRGKA